MDNDGITAEVLFPTPTRSRAAPARRLAPAWDSPATWNPELGLAGARAHNRWLAELCSDSPERRRGAALVQINRGHEDVLAEITRSYRAVCAR